MTTSDPEKKLALAFHAASTTEAELIRVLLEDAGIYAVITNRNNPLPGLDLNPFDPGSGNVGCDVYVSEVDLAIAKETINQSRKDAAEE